MKNFKFLLTTIFALFLMVAFASGQTAEKAKDKKEESVLFDVNMSCTSCKAKIEKNIPFEKGVKGLDVSLDDKTVLVKYRTDKTSEDAIRKAIEKLGYTAVVKSDDEQK